MGQNLDTIPSIDYAYWESKGYNLAAWRYVSAAVRQYTSKDAAKLTPRLQTCWKASTWKLCQYAQSYLGRCLESEM